jgi:glycosyltransferase involved in cell wall biosynthesis
VIVDDGSADGTAAAAAALAAARADTRVVRLSPGRGLGGALREGFAAARGAWIAVLDADLTFAPAVIKDMLALARSEDADLVAGSPYLRPGDMGGVPWARRLPSLMMNALYRGLFGMALTAYTPMFRLYRAEKLRALELRSDGFEISAEIAARARLGNWRVVEVPAALQTRTEGVSKLRRWRELSSHLRLIARLLAG